LFKALLLDYLIHTALLDNIAAYEENSVPHCSNLFMQAYRIASMRYSIYKLADAVRHA